MPIVLISGGTGLIGTNLTRHLTEQNYEVIILSRERGRTSGNRKVSYAYWDTKKGEIDIDAIKKADHIIHLAGAGVMDKRWTEEFKKRIVDSRTKSSELLIKALRENGHHVNSFISASAIGWYGADPQPLVHKDGFIETDAADTNSFLGETCVLWEASVEPVKDIGIRLVKLRTGVVLSNEGGAYKEFKMPSKFGIAGIIGNGKQIISWIHIDDISRMYIELMENEYASGSYNGVAPGPISNKTMMLQIAEALKGKFFIPMHVPEFLLKLALGKQSTEILKSTTVSDKKIKGLGFTFLYPTIEAAVEALAAEKN